MPSSPEFKVRKKNLMDLNPDDLYGRMRNLFFCLKIFHGGEFVVANKWEYIGGSMDILDMIESENLTVEVMKNMVFYLGKGKYMEDVDIFLHFKVPGTEFKNGLIYIQRNDDVRSMLEYVDRHKCLDIYVEHVSSVLLKVVDPSADSIGQEMDDDCVILQTSPEYNRQRKKFHSRRMLQYSHTFDVNTPPGNQVEEASPEMGLRDIEPGIEYLVDVDVDSEENILSDEDPDYVAGKKGRTEDSDSDSYHFETNVDSDVEWYAKAHKGDTSGSEEPVDEPLTLCLDELVSEDSEDGDGYLERGSTHGSKRKHRNPHFNKKRDMVRPKFILGQMFASKQEIRAAILQHSIDTRRELKIVKNDKTRLRARCEGFVPATVSATIEANAEIGDMTTPQKVECPWTLHASNLNSGTWQIKTFVEEHWCIQSRSIKACTTNFLARELTETIKRNPGVPISALKEDLEEKYQVNVSRMKAFRAKMTAHDLVIGSYKEQYSYLWDYCNEVKKTHPGTTMKIDVEPCGNPSQNTRVFRRLYCCLGPLKEGFKSGCRPLLGIDGTFMKGPFPGQILSAVALDSNNGLYPVAYALVETENFRSWSWFLTNLGDDFDLASNSNFCFISDRQKGLIPALAKIFPAAEHRYCLKHIWDNFKLTFKGLVYKDLLWSAATATNIPYFERAMEEVKKIDVKAWDWLQAIPPSNWSRSHFGLFPKSDILFNNQCETFNSKIVSGRDKPIITCLESIRMYIMKWITTVQQEINKCKGLLCPSIQKTLEETKSKANAYRALWNGGMKYQVNGPMGDLCCVDLQYKSCSCRKWDLTAIPCKHAVRAIWSNTENGGDSVPENWVDDNYKLSTWARIYSHKLNPINGRAQWEHIDGPAKLLPPKHHVQPGRPKKARRKTADEQASQQSRRSGNNMNSGVGRMGRTGSGIHCKKCGHQGHNSRTCKGQQSSQTPQNNSQESTNASNGNNATPGYIAPEAGGGNFDDRSTFRFQCEAPSRRPIFGPRGAMFMVGPSRSKKK